MHLESALWATAAVAPEDFGRFCNHLDPELIERCLLATASASVRKRRLPADHVILLLVGMGLYRNLPVTEVARSLDLVLPDSEGSTAIAPSAIPQARARLGEEPLRWLFLRTGQEWTDRSAGDHSFHGLSVWAVDGTSLSVADTPDNEQRFGRQSNQRGAGAYPQARMVVLMAAATHLLRMAVVGHYRQSEQDLATELWPNVPDNSVSLLDRGFFGAPILWTLMTSGQNRHWVTRQRANLKMRTIRQLGPGDRIVEMDVAKKSRRRYPGLPATWQFRVIEYQRRGFRPQAVLTSLTDEKAFPAEQLVELYHVRWEVELGYDELKTKMLERREALRSLSPSAVMQELWGVLLAYNLVRLEMVRIAAIAKVSPTRISFVTVLRELRTALLMWQYTSPGALPERLRRFEQDLARFVLPPRRSERSYPRAVKRISTSFPRKRSSPSRKTLN